MMMTSKRQLYAQIATEVAKLSLKVPLAVLTVVVRRGWNYMVALSDAAFAKVKVEANNLRGVKVSVMELGADEFDLIDGIVSNHIENVKLYAPNEARHILTVWINMKAQIMRKEINKQYDK